MALQADQGQGTVWKRLDHYKLSNSVVLGTKAAPHDLCSTYQRHANSAAKRHHVHLRCWVPQPQNSSSGQSQEMPFRSFAGNADGQSDPGQPSNGNTSSSSSNAPRGIRWLDREVKQGNVSQEKLVDGDGKPPVKTDRILRSYSKKARKSRQPWWRAALRGVVGVACVATGVTSASAGIGMLLTCIRTGTVFTCCAVTFTGVKLVVTGTNQVRKAVDEDALPIERGTTSRAWAILIAGTACMSTTAASLTLFDTVVRIYMRLVRFARNHANDVRFTLQSRKLLAHSADQVERAARTIFGENLTEGIQEQVNNAIELTEKVSKGLVTDISEEEAKRVMAALTYKLTLAYTFCGAVFLVPTLVNLLIAPPFGRRAMQAIRMAIARYKDWEDLVTAKVGRRFGPCVAAAGKVAIVLLAAKPFGLLGERLAAIPTVQIGLRPSFLKHIMPEMPEVEVKPVMNADGGTSSNIPLAARWFLQ